MIIKELHVKNFGKLQDTRVPFTEGLNLIYGANESGKTTLHTFLKCMLFGIRRSRGRAAAKDVYSRYEPWEYGHYYAGSMRFMSGGKEFYLDRNFQKDNVRAELFCVTDGERLSVKHGDLSMLLGNISEIVYDNTISVGQTKGVTDQDLALELKNYMANYQGTGDSDLDLEKAIQILKSQKKAFQGELKLKRSREDSKKNETTSKVLYLREEIKELEKRLQVGEHQLAQLERQKEALLKDPSVLEKIKEQVSKRRRLDILSAILAVFLVLAVVLLPGIYKTGVLPAGILLLGVYCLNRRKMKKKISAIQGGLQGDREALTRQTDRVKGRVHTQQEDLKEKRLSQEALLQRLHDHGQEVSGNVLRGKDPIEEEIEGIEMAMDAIGVITKRLQNEIGGQIRDRTSEILAELTRGKYHRVVIDKDLQMGVSTQERYIPVEQLSRGTMEQVYFALRMAVGDVLCGQEPMPVVLDDVFAMYDEERLMETLQWLIQHKEQILLFTCHKREGEILNAYGMPFHRVAVFDP